MDLKANDQLPLSIAEKDEFGNTTTASLDGPPQWSVDNTQIATVSAAADGMSAVVTPTGQIGSCNVQLLASVAGKQLQGTLPLNLIAGDAAQVSIVPGTPVPFTPGS